MPKHFVSVVVPCLNSEKTIRECVLSLLSQTYPKDRYEIIVIDNGSTDGSKKILRGFGHGIILLEEKRKGAYLARNRGIMRAKGEIVAFTDSDCKVSKDWIKHIEREFSSNEVGIVGGKTRSIGRGGAVERYCDLFCTMQHRCFRSKVPFFGCANMAIRKECIDAAGHFNTELASGGDVEICKRILARHCRIVYAPKAAVLHDYQNSILDLMKRHFRYGKGNGMGKEKFGYHAKIKMPGYLYVYRTFGTRFLLLRALQDLSYHLGFFLRQPL